MCSKLLLHRKLGQHSLELHSRCYKLLHRNLDRKRFQRHNLGRMHFRCHNLDHKRFQRRILGRKLGWCHSSLYRSRHLSNLADDPKDRHQSSGYKG